MNASSSGHRHGNFFTDPYTHSPEEFIETLITGNGSLRIERIISEGQVSPPGFWYDQDEFEFVIVLKGNAILEFADGTILELALGDWVLIREHERHRVAYTSNMCVWLAVFGKN